MQRPVIIATAALMLVGLAGCGSPPTKSIRTTTTTTTVDDNGNASATARSELRTNVPVVKQTENPSSESNTSPATAVAGPGDSQKTVEQRQSTSVDGTTIIEKRVTTY